MVTTHLDYLTKSGYGSVPSMAHNAALSEDVETKLDEADRMAKETAIRYDADEVFGRVKARICDSERA